MSKKCPRCNEVKEITEFGKNKQRKDGLAVYCRPCANAKANNTYRKNPERQKAANQKYAEANPDKVKEINITARKKYYQENKEKCLAEAKQWRAENREWMRKYYRDKRQDTDYRLKGNLRTRISLAVANDSAIKLPTQELLGCDIPFLKKHLEAQFSEGMSWDNYGEWEIDYIIPCAAFDFNDPEQQRACFHYQNLQPLWKRDNIIKGGRIDNAA